MSSVNEHNNAANEIRVVAAIDLGTTYSSFACADKTHPKKIFVHDYGGSFETPTVLAYDEDLNLISWGVPALADRARRRAKNVKELKSVELFKLHLGRDIEGKSLQLPEGIDHKRAITDYLRGIGEMMKKYLMDEYEDLDFFDQVVLVMTVPSEFDNKAIMTMRECAFEADLTNSKKSRNLKFITEPEAAAIHCMNFLSGNEVKVGDSFMIVDCGGGTVDLTTRQLLSGNTLGEITERTGGYCGSSYVDDEFIKFLENKIGKSTFEKFKEKNQRQLQYLIQEFFCKRVKLPFIGDDDTLTVEMSIEELCPALKQCCEGEVRQKLEGQEWTIELTFEDIKAMFDPTVAKILRLIREQLSKSECSAIILVGGYSESKYLQRRIKQEFQDRLKNISVPISPMIAVVKGAVEFGLKEHVIMSRVLKWTYGTDIVRRWEEDDPTSKKMPNGMVKAFHTLAKRGTHVTNQDTFTTVFKPYSLFQTKVSFDMYVSPETDVKYFDDDSVELLDEWEIDIPILEDFDDQTILLILYFVDGFQLAAIAENQKTGDKYQIRLTSKD